VDPEHRGRTSGARCAAIVLLIIGGLGVTVPTETARPVVPPAPAPVVERVAVYPARVVFGRGERLRARPLPARLLTLEKQGGVWDDAPLASERLAPPRLRGLGRRRPATRCAPRFANGDSAAQPRVQLSAGPPGASVSAVFALARRAPAREVRPYPGGAAHARGRRYRTKWFELCASAQAKAAEGGGIDTVAAVLSAASRDDRLIGWKWGTRARRGLVSRTGELLRGRAIVRDRGLLSGGQGPGQLPQADFDRHLANQVFGFWEAPVGTAPRGPAGNTALGLFELPLKARTPAFLIAVAVAYHPQSLGL
jgi:hypothetical protein